MSNTDIHHYDLICIGSGSGGFSAAMAAKAEGLKNILLVEKRASGTAYARTKAAPIYIITTLFVLAAAAAGFQRRWLPKLKD